MRSVAFAKFYHFLITKKLIWMKSCLPSGWRRDLHVFVCAIFGAFFSCAGKSSSVRRNKEADHLNCKPHDYVCLSVCVLRVQLLDWFWADIRTKNPIRKKVKRKRMSALNLKCHIFTGKKRVQITTIGIGFCYFYTL